MQAPELFHARPRPLTRAEYDKMAELGFFRGERVELVHGIVVRMTPIGPPHSEIVDRLTKRLVLALGDRARVRVQAPYLAADDSEPEPDIAVVPSRSYATAHPSEAMLIIEVADTSIEYDRKTKAPLYASSNVAEYWIVDIAGQCVELFAGPTQGRFTRTRTAALVDDLRPESFPDVTLPVRKLFE